MLSLTTSAASQIRRAASDAGPDDWALRVAARQEKDGSITYGMGFDEPREGDMPLQIQGVNLVIAPPSQAMLESIVLDFVEIEPGCFQFIFAPGSDSTEATAKACGNGGCSGCAT